MPIVRLELSYLEVKGEKIGLSIDADWDFLYPLGTIINTIDPPEIPEGVVGACDFACMGKVMNISGYMYQPLSIKDKMPQTCISLHLLHQAYEDQIYKEHYSNSFKERWDDFGEIILELYQKQGWKVDPKVM